jgi:endonuclease/exonuclease/phosphatase (EEP) superfamily protein YafD
MAEASPPEGSERTESAHDPAPLEAGPGAPLVVPEPPPSDRELPPKRRRFPPFAVSLTIAAGLGLAGLWGVTFVGRHHLTPWAPVAAMTLVLPWLYLAGATVGVALLAWRPVRRPMAALLVPLVGTALVLWGADWIPRHAPPGGEEVRVISWNVARLGEFAPWAQQPAAQEQALDCVAGALRREAPDAVVLLEISRERLAALSAELDYDCQTTDYFNTRNPRHGGLAVCAPRAGRWMPTGLARMPELPPEWHYVFSELENGGARINVLAVHFRPYGVTTGEVAEGVAGLTVGKWRRVASLAREVERAVGVQGQQVRQLLAALGTFHDPTVLAGDFNGTPDFAVHVELRRKMVDVWRRAGFGPGPTRTVGGWLPLRIDYVYASDRLPPRKAWLLPDRCSDHRAVATDLRVEP